MAYMPHAMFLQTGRMIFILSVLPIDVCLKYPTEIGQGSVKHRLPYNIQNVFLSAFLGPV